jgi:DNA-binding transcriptional regulator/RsmH inhibitor MraZ
MRAQKSAGSREVGRWCACILLGFSGPVAELAATGLTVALGQADEQRWLVVASRYNRFPKASRHTFRRSVPISVYGLFIQRGRMLRPLTARFVSHCLHQGKARQLARSLKQLKEKSTMVDELEQFQQDLLESVRQMKTGEAARVTQVPLSAAAEARQGAVIIGRNQQNQHP